MIVKVKAKFKKKISKSNKFYREKLKDKRRDKK